MINKKHDERRDGVKKIMTIEREEEGGEKFSLAVLSFNLRFFGSYFKEISSTTLSIESTCLPRARGLIGAESIMGRDTRLRRDIVED